MDDEIRKYLRKLNAPEKRRLESLGKQRIARRRNGFLTKDQVEKLSRLKRWEKKTTASDMSKYFWEIREKTDSAIIDFKIICDTLEEEELERILTETTELDYLGKRISMQSYPLGDLLASLLPQTHATQEISKEIEEAKLREQWRKTFLEEVVTEGLAWYFYSGLCKTDAEKKILFDAIDMVSVKSSGLKKYYLMQHGEKLELVKF